MDVAASDVSAWIAECVRGGPNQGSRLAHAVRERFPEWTPQSEGARNLRDFIERFVEDVAVVGRSGMDVVYGLSSDVSGTSQEPSSNQDDGRPVNLWRVWVSPNSPYALSIDMTDGDVQAVSRPAPDLEGKVRQEPASRDFHEQLAQSFGTQVQGERQVQLPAVGGTDRWWFEWQEKVRELGLEPSWQDFRSDALVERLESEMTALGVGEQARRAAVRRVLADKSARRSTAKRRSDAWNQRADLEALVIEAARRMDASDLRALRIPVGVILDVIANRPLK